MGVLESFSLSGKTCLITGGAGLLGRKHAEAFLEAGARVVLIDINKTLLEKTVSELAIKAPSRIDGFICDITNEQALLDLRDNILKAKDIIPNVLVNNAAIDAKFSKSQPGKPMSRLENFPLENWQMELAVGLGGSFLCAKIFGYQMAQKGGGVIINVASDLGLISPNQNLYKIDGLAADAQPVKPVTYSVVKHGLIGLTKYLATYWAEQGVRCNALAPGGAFNDHSDEFVAKIGKLIPMGRMAKIDEYKAVMVFLASEASSYMTGAVVSVDGGRTVW